MDTLTTLVQVGGPVFALAAFVIWLNHNNMKSLITALTNHLTHTEIEQKETNRLLTILVERDRRKD